MDQEEIVINRVSNGWLIRCAPRDHRDRFLAMTEMAVAETTGALLAWVFTWAQEQAGKKKEAA